MPWIQDINPNVNIPCQPGWCEKYVRESFHQPAKYATATAAWNGQEDKHTDRNQPGVAVPVYWGLAGNAAGHDAVWMPDGSVYSASIPNSTKPGKFASLAAIEKYYGGKLQWRGWGSYVSHTRVAHWEEPPVPPTPEPTPAGAQPGDHVTTTATTDAGNGKTLNLAIINDGKSIFGEVNSKGNAVLRRDSDNAIRAQVPVDSLRKL